MVTVSASASAYSLGGAWVSLHPDGLQATHRPTPTPEGLQMACRPPTGPQPVHGSAPAHLWVSMWWGLCVLCIHHTEANAS